MLAKNVPIRSDLTGIPSSLFRYKYDILNSSTNSVMPIAHKTIVAIQVANVTFTTNDQHSSSSCKGTSGLLHITGSNTGA